jgi:hypothetical protein
MDLNILADNGVVLSNVARAFLDNGPAVNENITGQIIRLLMVGTMFLVTISYPVYCKRSSQN